MSQSPPPPLSNITSKRGSTLNRRPLSIGETALARVRTQYFKKEYAEVTGWRGSSDATGVDQGLVQPTVTRPHAAKSLREVNQFPKYPHSRVHSLLSSPSHPLKPSPPRSSPPLHPLASRQLHLDAESPPHIDRIYLQSSRTPTVPASRHSHCRSDLTDEVLKIPSIPPTSSQTYTRENSVMRLSRSNSSDSVDSQDGWGAKLPFTIPGSARSVKANVPQPLKTASFDQETDERPQPSADFQPVSEGVMTSKLHTSPSPDTVLLIPAHEALGESSLDEAKTNHSVAPETDARVLSTRQVVFRDLFQGRKVVRSLSFSSKSHKVSGQSLFDIFLRGLITGVIKNKEQAAGFIKTEVKNAHLMPLKSGHKRRQSTDAFIKPKFLLQADIPSPKTASQQLLAKKRLTRDTVPQTIRESVAMHAEAPQSRSATPQSHDEASQSHDEAPQSHDEASQSHTETVPPASSRSQVVVQNSDGKYSTEVGLRPVFTDLNSIAMTIPKDEMIETRLRCDSIMSVADKGMKTGRTGSESSVSGTDRYGTDSARKEQTRNHRGSAYSGTKSTMKTSAEWLADKKLLDATLSPLLPKSSAETHTDLISLPVPDVPRIVIDSGDAATDANSRLLLRDNIANHQRRSLLFPTTSELDEKQPRRSSMMSPPARRGSISISQPVSARLSTAVDAIDHASISEEKASLDPSQLCLPQIGSLQATSLVRRNSTSLPSEYQAQVSPTIRRRASMSYPADKLVLVTPRPQVTALPAAIDLPPPDPVEDFIFQFAQSLLASLQEMTFTSVGDSQEAQEQVIREKLKLLRETKARRVSVYTPGQTPVTQAVRIGVMRTFSEQMLAKRGMSVGPKELMEKVIEEGRGKGEGKDIIVVSPPLSLETSTKLSASLSPPFNHEVSPNNSLFPSPQDISKSPRSKSSKPRVSVRETRRPSSIKSELHAPVKKKQAEEISGSEGEESPEAGLDLEVKAERDFLAESVEFELKHMAMVKKLAEGIIDGRHPMPRRKVRFFNIALDEEEQKQKELEDKVIEIEEEEASPPRPEVVNFEVAWQKEAEENDLREDVTEVLTNLMKNKQTTVRDFAFSSKVNFDFQSVEELRKERAYRDLESNENPDEEGLLSALMREKFLTLCQSQPKLEDLQRLQKRILHMSDSTGQTSDEQLAEFRHALQKRINKEKVMRNRVGQEHVRLRAKPVITFTGLPAESLPTHKRMTSAHSEKLLIDGKAKLVKDPRELQERIYLRLKGDPDLGKFGKGPKVQPSTSLSSSVRVLTAMHSRPGSVL